jgi:dTDP-4-dehydrorhamnose 3,5-epimerase
MATEREKMRLLQTEIDGVVLIEPQVFGDERGYFMETYNQNDFQKSGIFAEFVQDNMSRSIRGTLRGLHYQLDPHAQGKLVRVIQGVVFDVAVDIRKNSPTFKQWVSVELSADNKLSMYIPPGFAHGFYVLSETAEFIYKCTNFYAPDFERGFMWNDSEIDIKWPIQDNRVILSKRDGQFPRFQDAQLF